MRFRSAVFTTFIALGLWFLAGSAWAAIPTMVPVQGHLRDASGTPVEGAHDLSFALFTASTGGVALYTERREGLMVTKGDFIVYLGELAPDVSDGGMVPAGDAGAASSLTPGFFRDHNDLWLEVIIDGTDVIQPRFRVGTVPYASFSQYCAEPAGALLATLHDIRGKETALEQKVTALQTQIATLQGQMTMAQTQLTALTAKVAALEAKPALTSVTGFNITSGDFYAQCIANPAHAQNCGVMANRACGARGYSGGWFVGESDGTLLHVVCVK
ncbi:MAG TPA: hypothetical protein VJT73_01915 [Polyangiaceae bacterium]|nr:hypothetical protein [Polyangiaceae bacterium]